MRGHHLCTEAAPLLSEYLDRMKLAKLGYRFDVRSLDCEKADAFVKIADEIDRARAEEQERASKRRAKR